MDGKTILFDNVVFDKEDKTFTILQGSVGTYSYTEIKKCAIVYEDYKYTGKSELFSHQVLVTKVLKMAVLPYVCTGVRFTMSDGKNLYAYISKKKLSQLSDELDKEKQKAQDIKKLVDKIIDKYQK